MLDLWAHKYNFPDSCSNKDFYPLQVMSKQETREQEVWEGIRRNYESIEM